MHKNFKMVWGAALVSLSLISVPQWRTAMAQPDEQPPAAPADEQPEVLTRGPVHESFAEPVITQTQEDVTSPTEPPANIEETPPDEKPQGGNVAWVPGYWAWDADRKGHIWVSGCWRTAPPKMSWVSGYWAQGAGRWTWVPGFWTSAGSQEIEYLPAPPDVANVAPPGEPTVANTIWVPPCYYRVDGRYTLRPGYWLGAQEGWVWMPSHYVHTPRGHVFVAGYWDYGLARRGVLFAPVAFSPGFRVHAGFAYSPSIVIETDLLTASLFVYPSYHHYFFGDYYDAGYVSAGIYPWFEVETSHRWCDPIFEHDRWQHRVSDPHWDENLHHDYDNRRAHIELRPARTYRELEIRVAKAPEPQRRKIEFAQPLARVVVSKTVTMKFEHVTPAARVTIAKQAVDANKFRDERTKWEATKRTPTPPIGRPGTVSPNEHKEVAVTPTDRNRSTTATPVDRSKESVVPVSPRPAQATPAVENHDKVTPPAEHHESAAASTDHKAPVAAPTHDTAPNTSDRVKMRSRPIADQPSTPSAAASPSKDKGPPASPANENNPRSAPSKDAKNSDGKNASRGGSDGKDAKKSDGQDSHSDDHK